MAENVSAVEFDITQSLVQGQAGEDLFENEFIGIVKPHPERDGDFTVGPWKIELKTEGPDKRTGNLFIEWFSNDEYKTPGGAWKAIKDGSHFFFQHYQHKRMLYVFEPHILCQFVKDNWKEVAIPSHREGGYYVRNRTKQGKHEVTWEAWGHAIPIPILEPLCIATWEMKRKEVFEDEKRKFWQELFKRHGELDIPPIDISDMKL